MLSWFARRCQFLLSHRSPRPRLPARTSPRQVLNETFLSGSEMPPRVRRGHEPVGCGGKRAARYRAVFHHRVEQENPARTR